MIRNNTASLLLASFLFTNLTPVASAARGGGGSPENKCIQNIIEAAGSHTAFSDIDFSALVKTNGPDGSKVSSKPFSVTDHNEFLEIADTPVPLIDDDLSYFPDELEKVSPNYVVTEGVHKSNRNNGAYLLYSDGTSTSIGDIDGDGEDETIDGYYVDSRYVTFGDQSDLEFSFPTRDPNPDDDREFPMGSPLKDMRQYLFFTHHLASKYGGKFMSCGLVKVSPTDDYALKSYAGEKSIRWTYYGFPRPQQTNVRTNVKNRGGDKFRIGDIRFIVSAKEVDTANGGYQFDNELLKYNVLISAYDNRSNFMNEFKTLKIFEENMNDTTNATSSFVESRLSFYRALIDKLNLGILGNLELDDGLEEDSVSSIDPTQLYASVLDAGGSDTTKSGGLSIMPGVSLETYEKVESIEDETTKNMLRSALIPDYGGMIADFTEKPASEMNDFEKAYNEYPLTYEERVENVEYILENSGGEIENLTPENFEYKDMVFGEAVIPVTDKRIRDIVSQSYLDNEMAELEAKKQAELDKVVVTDDMSITDQQAAYRAQDEIERRYEGELSKLMTFEGELANFKVKFADVENQFEHGRITESEYETKRKALLNDFNNTVKTGQLADSVSSDRLKALSQSLTNRVNSVQENQSTSTDETSSGKKGYSTQTLIVKGSAVALFIIAIGLALLAIRKIKKNSNTK